MKKGIRILAVLAALLLMTVSASAAVVVEDTYSDAPANATQDNIKQLAAQYVVNGAESGPYTMTPMAPTQRTVDIMNDIFTFVDINKQPPVRYFPEETQEEIRKLLVHGDPDALYMPEFMSLMPEKMQQDADVAVSMEMNIDYHPGQTVVPVMGRYTENGVEWKALPARVEVDDTICFDVPKDIMQQFAGQETFLALMAFKPGTSESEWEKNLVPKDEFIPSKNAGNIIYVVEEKLRNVDGQMVDCQIVIVPHTEKTRAEADKLTEHFTHQEKVPVRYFDEHTVQEVSLILKHTNVDTLLPFEMTQVMAVDYLEPYGDVMARFSFPTPFEEDQAVIAMLGLPDEGGEGFAWMPLYAEKDGRFVEITFSSSVLPQMMEEAGLLLVMGEPIVKAQ